jgi:hypothetical protein
MTAYQRSDRARPEAGMEEKKTEPEIQVTPPGLYRLSRLDNDPSFRERVKQESKVANPNERTEFPDEPILSHDTYQGRGNLWAARQVTAEPTFLCHQRLYFEDKNSERYGWDLGIFQPFVSAGLFYADLAMVPYHCATDPFRKYDCNVGYCLPGDPVPYLLYPPEISVTGAAGEVAVILALVAIFP